MKHYVPIPERIAKKLRAAGNERLAGTLNGVPFRRALAKRSNGEPCLKFGAGWLRDHGFEVDTKVDVTLAPDLDPAGVDVPEELTRALGEHPRLAKAWDMLTPGRRRTLAYPVLQAKRPETRSKRAAAVLEVLRTGVGPKTR